MRRLKERKVTTIADEELRQVAESCKLHKKGTFHFLRMHSLKGDLGSLVGIIPLGISCLNIYHEFLSCLEFARPNALGHPSFSIGKIDRCVGIYPADLLYYSAHSVCPSCLSLD
jgi:hypothetical protein